MKFVFLASACVGCALLGAVAASSGLVSLRGADSVQSAVSTEPVPMIESAPVAPSEAPTSTPIPVDPSRQLATDLRALAQRTGPVLEGIGRWAKAISAGLPAQPNEIADLRAQVVGIDQDARALRARAHSDGISPHVERAADATSEASQQILAGVDLADETVDVLINKRQAQTGMTLANLAVEHIQRATKLYQVAGDELNAYGQETPTA